MRVWSTNTRSVASNCAGESPAVIRNGYCATNHAPPQHHQIGLLAERHEEHIADTREHGDIAQRIQPREIAAPLTDGGEQRRGDLRQRMKRRTVRIVHRRQRGHALDGARFQIQHVRGPAVVAPRGRTPIAGASVMVSTMVSAMVFVMVCADASANTTGAARRRNACRTHACTASAIHSIAHPPM